MLYSFLALVVPVIGFLCFGQNQAISKCILTQTKVPLIHLHTKSTDIKVVLILSSKSKQ